MDIILKIGKEVEAYNKSHLVLCTYKGKKITYLRSELKQNSIDFFERKNIESNDPDFGNDEITDETVHVYESNIRLKNFKRKFNGLNFFLDYLTKEAHIIPYNDSKQIKIGRDTTELNIQSKVNYWGVDYLVVKISKFSFACYSKIETILLPNNISVIEEQAFNDCIKLKNIQLPESLLLIGDYAFSDCLSLEFISIPDKTEYIGKRAFYNCSSLKTIHLPASLSKVGFQIFDSCTSLETIYVPTGMVDFLCKIGLRNYRNLMKEY